MFRLETEETKLLASCVENVGGIFTVVTQRVDAVNFLFYNATPESVKAWEQVFIASEQNHARIHRKQRSTD